MELKGSKTERNLMTAFAGESQARNRYSYAVKAAREEGYVQMAQIFEETANQEKAHAKRLFRFLEGGEVEITAAFPAGTIGTTLENLLSAAQGEEHEYQEMYPAFARTAQEEGFPVIAKAFESIAVAEKQHARRFRALMANIEKNQVFRQPEPTVWRCLECGYVHEGTEAPAACPACLHKQAHFERLAENW